MKHAAFAIAGVLLPRHLWAHSGHEAAAHVPAVGKRAAERVLVTQHGDRVRFYSDVLKGRVVLLSFVFTSCVDTCPMQTRKLAAVQSLLAGWMGNTIRFVSISVDPERDRPEVLRDYAARFDAGPGWLFLTGAKRDVDDVVGRLGQAVAAPENHTSLFLAGDLKAGRWSWLHPDTAPLEIAEHLLNLVRETS
jgi:protein SCO1